MKLILEPIDVMASPDPTALCWRGRLFEVETVLEEWTARGDWWGKEDRRHYFLLMTSNGVVEVYQGREGWMVSRIYD